MSYSFSVRAGNKAAALSLVADKLAEVEAAQASHEIDKASAMAAATAFVNHLADDDNKDVIVNMSGSISWAGSWGDGAVDVLGASVSVHANLVPRHSIV